MALRTSRQPTGRTNLRERPATSSLYDSKNRTDIGERYSYSPSPTRRQDHQIRRNQSRSPGRFKPDHGQLYSPVRNSRPATSQEPRNRNIFTPDNSGNRNMSSRNLQNSGSRIFQSQSSKPVWHPSLGKDHDPQSAGLDTQRIAHELEWDDQQLDEDNMTSARLARAKAFVVHEFVTKELDPTTVQVTPALQGLDQNGIFEHFSNTNAFSKNLREIKYLNRRLATKNSSNVASCLSLPEVGGVNAVDMFDVNEVDAKPYSTGVFSKTSTGVKSCKELKYVRSQENLKAGADWLAKDQSYLKPGVSFKRVAAYARDTYVSR